MKISNVVVLVAGNHVGANNLIAYRALQEAGLNVERPEKKKPTYNSV